MQVGEEEEGVLQQEGGGGAVGGVDLQALGGWGEDRAVVKILKGGIGRIREDREIGEYLVHEIRQREVSEDERVSGRERA